MKCIKLMLKWALVCSAWAGVLGIILIFYYSSDLPELNSSDVQKSKSVVRINYDNDSNLTNFGENVGSEVAFYELPPHLINAVVATEDRRFFDHLGVDVFGILRAFYVNQKAGRIVQGGSTITQQLAKVIFLNSDRNFKRKIQEVLLAMQLEYRFTKEKILTLYLNRAYFGSGNYGVNDAAKFYFGKNVSKINLHEAAMLAGLLKAPSKLSPKNNKDLAEKRARVVIRNMVNAGFLADENIAQLHQEYAYKTESLQKLYFADFAKSQFPDFIHKKYLKEENINVQTTLNEDVQKGLEESLRGFFIDNGTKLAQSQIAVIIMQKDGAILGMSGGKNYQKSQFNRAIYAKRQSGSAFKTFIYLTAFENGYTPDDLFEDKEIDVGDWLPKNYNGNYFGEVTLKTAFAKSLNSVAVQLAQKLDEKDIIKTAHRLGILSKIDANDLTIVLGTTQVSLYELTAAYATIANDGEAVIPYVITNIDDGRGTNLYNRHSSGLGAVISQGAGEYMKEVMRETVANGTGKNANIADNIYGKTGTTQNFRDAFFIGFDDEMVVGVWIGNDDNTPTNKITGGSLPAKLFAKIMKNIR